jgi:hypothetical protein
VKSPNIIIFFPKNVLLPIVQNVVETLSTWTKRQSSIVDHLILNDIWSCNVLITSIHLLTSVSDISFPEAISNRLVVYENTAVCAIDARCINVWKGEMYHSQMLQCNW